MQFFRIVILMLITSACSEPTAQQKRADEQKNLLIMINTDDARACASPEAIETAFNAANREYQSFRQQGMPAVRVDTISATDINKDIHEITCQATGHYKIKGLDEDISAFIVYKLRPSLDKTGTFIVETGGNTGGIAASQIRWWSAEISERSPLLQNSISPMANADESASSEGDEKVCSANVLHEVSSVEDPTSKMSKGEVFDYVTQFWRVKKTGDGKFCQKGGYCYPSDIYLNGKKTEAIKLINCSIGSQRSDDEDEILFSVE